MDFGKVLGRAWEITWRWKILWLLGFLASLGQGTPGTTSSYTITDQDIYYNQLGIDLPYEEFIAGIIGIAILACCLLIVIAIALWVVSVIARGGLIAAVQQIETEGSTSFRRAWVAGRRKFWTLFGLGILAAIPIIILVFFGLVLIGAGVGLGVGLMDVDQVSGIATMVSAVSCIGVFLCCGLVLMGIVLEQIRVYGERAAILEDLGWIDAFVRGWQVLKQNLGATIILWLIFLAIGIGIFIISIPFVLMLALPVIALLPFVDSGLWFLVPICIGGLLAVIIFALVRSVAMVFTSATWTLAYREFVGTEPEVVNDDLLEESPS